MTNRTAIAAVALIGTVNLCSGDSATTLDRPSPMTSELSKPSAEQTRSLDEYFTEMAGAAAVDCGRLPPLADFFALSPALQCLKRANRRHEPFQFVQYGTVLDSGRWAEGLVGRDGVIHRFRQSTVVCPGTPCGEHFWFKTEICTSPRVGWHQLVCDALLNPVR